MDNEKIATVEEVSNNEVTITKNEPIELKTYSKKKGVFHRFAAATFRSVSWTDIGNNIMREILIPNIQTMVSTALKSTVDSIVYGHTQYYSNSYDNKYQVGRNGVNTNARQYNARYSSSARYENKPINRYTYTPEYPSNCEVLFDAQNPEDSRREANAKLKKIVSEAREYGYLKVGDVYDICKVPVNKMDFNFGWSYNEILNGAYVVQVNDGSGLYMLKMPKATAINR